MTFESTSRASRYGPVVPESQTAMLPLALLAALAIGGCGGSGSSEDGELSPVDSGPTNVNVADPVLRIADNAPVRPGSALNLVWSDEFDDARLDPRTWFFEVGDGSQYGIPGWGNNELQWYLADGARTGGGLLILTARRQQQGTHDYTSARINTRDRFAFRYGRIEARIRLPGGQGIWPAFWLMPQEDTYGTWAASGEIDIVEARNLGRSGTDTVVGTLHYGGMSPNNVFSGDEYVVAGSATADFHEYALEWDPNEIRWYVDGVLYAVQSYWFTESADYPAPFDQPFYVILNVAVGGSFPGAPDSTTVFPVSMEVDYVRVYSGAD